MIKCIPIYGLEREIVPVVLELFNIVCYDLDVLSMQVENFRFVGVYLKGNKDDYNKE